MHYKLPHPGQGILGPAPAIYSSQPTTLPSVFSIMPPQDPTWHMDTGASSHLNFNASNLSTIFDKRLFSSVHVGDGTSIPVTNTGYSIIPSHHRPLHLHKVLVTPNIIKNLISVRQFTRDNNCTIEFDAFGFSVKDYLTRHILFRCDSSSDLYPVTKPSTSPTAFLSTSASTWHQRLGHPGDQVLCSLVSSRFISCNKEKSSHICHACQLGKLVKLPFYISDSIVEHCFDIIHSDVWTSSIISSSGLNTMAPGALVFSYLLPLLIFRWFGLTKQTKHHSSALVLIEYWVLLMLLQKTTWIRIPLRSSVPSRFQYADIFTKGLPSALFEDFCSSLSVWPPPAPTAGAY
ncbi:ribonuclease H-like domain-containing protein [Tanacetum coccineum]|uniref:Ribonuclease H-like domain-containing protein n=1 Tax=Tanacetum coccineum TaxID=301880 RepID=A0ABQ5I9R4_9ASTR